MSWQKCLKVSLLLLYGFVPWSCKTNQQVKTTHKFSLTCTVGTLRIWLAPQDEDGAFLWSLKSFNELLLSGKRKGCVSWARGQRRPAPAVACGLCCLLSCCCSCRRHRRCCCFSLWRIWSAGSEQQSSAAQSYLWPACFCVLSSLSTNGKTGHASKGAVKGKPPPGSPCAAAQGAGSSECFCNTWRRQRDTAHTQKGDTRPQTLARRQGRGRWG